MEAVPMKVVSRALVAALVCLVAVAGCKNKETQSSDDIPGFSFTVYPGSHYLAQLTDARKKALQQVNPREAAAPMAIYEVDAPVEQVAEYYAKAYGYSKVAPDAADLSVTKPPAYYRSGDLNSDTKAIESLLPKIGLQTDVSKAQGKYKAAEIEAKTNRPHVTVQRPYFDVSTSQVVDRTMILMAR
jgi:hypothetical protein